VTSIAKRRREEGDNDSEPPNVTSIANVDGDECEDEV
jgi:hypothetical protein